MPRCQKEALRSHSYENVFRLQVHFHVNQTDFDMKGFAGRLVLKPRHKVDLEVAY